MVSRISGDRTRNLPFLSNVRQQYQTCLIDDRIRHRLDFTDDRREHQLALTENQR